ncbi:PTB domain-containing engulfment adapter protein 1 isoform X2 [Gouania willdenowi]|uniref:PTB domain-containing engulfment adapter protein 1 isoform X2 n=1 Tax=Gouania willdenowi TaxID=441366 RepID=UPI00105685B9|nr:PTB domain-containing engulfment adapter protein 1-like isoform X2 [Gouania willdenowi]
MNDTSEDDNEISFLVKFLGRVEVVHPDGLQVLQDAALSLKFLLYSCPMSTVSFCAILPSSPKVCGFVARHPAADRYHCYLFKSKSLAPVLVSVIGDTFRVSKRNESVRGGRDLIVEALRHKNKVLQKENAELKRRLAKQAE